MTTEIPIPLTSIYLLRSNTRLSIKTQSLVQPKLIIIKSAEYTGTHR